MKLRKLIQVTYMDCEAGIHIGFHKTRKDWYYSRDSGKTWNKMKVK